MFLQRFIAIKWAIAFTQINDIWEIVLGFSHSVYTSSKHTENYCVYHYERLYDGI